jgi:hypothetical protein
MSGLRNRSLPDELRGTWVDRDGRRWTASRFDRRGRVVLRDGNEFTVRWPAELAAPDAGWRRT